MLCFSDNGPDIGRTPTSQEELRAAFNPSKGWNVAAIEPDRIQTRHHDHRRTGPVRAGLTKERSTDQIAEIVPPVKLEKGVNGTSVNRLSTKLTQMKKPCNNPDQNPGGS